MIKKYATLKWLKEEKDPFPRIKEAIMEAPTPKSPDFEKEFILYTFTF